MSDQVTELVEGVDYYVEHGRWVFTAEYHRKRGRCCQSGCRHFPFRNSPADRDRIAAGAARSNGAHEATVEMEGQ
jgi:hypothetical protein